MFKLKMGSYFHYLSKKNEADHSYKISHLVHVALKLGQTVSLEFQLTKRRKHCLNAVRRKNQTLDQKQEEQK